MTSSQGIGKMAPIKERVIFEVEYSLIDNLKRAKAKISLFELLKIPSIREILPNNTVLNKSRESQNHNLEFFSKVGYEKSSTLFVDF